MTIPPVRFAKYNLGADPTFDTPKKQMQYLDTINYSTMPDCKAKTAYLDATVLGGLFQWGRKWDKTSDATSYPVSVSGTYLRYTGDGSANHSASMSTFSLTNDYDFFGQPNSIHAGNHLYDGSGTNDYDWLVKVTTGLTPPIIYNTTLGMSPNRWGNGVAVSTKTTPYGVLFGTDYYQSTNRIYPENDPCPDGFRVPTQDEWERLGAYGCNPNSAGGSLLDIPSSGKETGKGLIWVPVRAGKANKDGWTSDAAVSTDIGGYAIYEEAVWTNAESKYKNGDDKLYDDDAPEPILFLPAAGYRFRNNGKVYNTGCNGYYWSSTVFGLTAHYLYLGSGYVYPGYNNNRVYGFSIRCVMK
jgi:hypothetical protein